MFNDPVVYVLLLDLIGLLLNSSTMTESEEISIITLMESIKVHLFET